MNHVGRSRRRDSAPGEKHAWVAAGATVLAAVLAASIGAWATIRSAKREAREDVEAIAAQLGASAGEIKQLRAALVKRDAQLDALVEQIRLLTAPRQPRPTTNPADSRPADMQDRVARQLRGVWKGTIWSASADSDLPVQLDFTKCESANACTVVVRNQDPPSEMLVSDRISVEITREGIIRFFQIHGPARRHASNPCPLLFLTHGGDYELTVRSGGTVLAGIVRVHNAARDPCGTLSMEKL